MHSRKNIAVASSLTAVVLGMVMLAYASVPLLPAILQGDGFRGDDASGGESAFRRAHRQTMTVSFDAQVGEGLPWDFEPEERQATVRIGASRLAIFRATNHGSKPITGSAVYNVTPNDVGAYFVKVQCFCFTKQTIAPGETVHFPVSFYIDPEIMHDRDTRDVTNITLSYTFYPAK